MKTTPLSNAQLTDYSAEHLLYELQLFVWAGRELGRREVQGPLRSALIESFVIHLRNLVDFFFTARGHDDDVVAADFYPDWNKAISARLKDARERANRELSHLTLGRKSGLHPDKSWDVGGLFQEIHEVAMCFATGASPQKLSPEVSKWLGLFRSDTVKALEVANMHTTNTTSTVITGNGGK
jgi:hypothetical protein